METKVLLVDDHSIFRKGLRLLFEEEGDIHVVGEAKDGQSACDRVRELLPDVVVMDITMPGVNGIDATRRIVSEFPATKIIALSVHSGKGFVDDMLRAGAAGYILKASAPEELIHGIRTVMRGDIYLSAAITGIVVTEYKDVLSAEKLSEKIKKLNSSEKKLLQLIMDGENKNQVAVLLGLNRDTVEVMLRLVLEKIGIENESAFLETINGSRFFNKEQVSDLVSDKFAVPIKKTKLIRPQLPSGHIQRKRLIKRLEQYCTVPLTMISAPAGYGKSTLVSSWLETVNKTSVWISIDEKDNDFRLFLSYFVSTIQTIFPDALQSMKKLLMAQELPSGDYLAENLVNELYAIRQEFILVIDDIHIVREKKIYNLISHLLRHPIHHMHLVFLGRWDPSLAISSLRARNQIHEIRIRDLRFTATETSEYLENEFKQQIKQETVEQWTVKTEGWITGLRLAALSIHHRGNVESLLPELTGSIQYITEYLFNELLMNLSPETRNYMMSSSIVDRFCAPLCEALAGKNNVPDVREPEEHNISGWQFLEILQKENLFAINLDTENHWFRFHHMFQLLLQNQLKRYRANSDINDLHSRASKWFFDNNLIDEGLTHAILSGDMPGAAEYVEKNRQSVQNNDKWIVLKKWLQLFPDSYISQRPGLLLAQAWIFLIQFKIIEIIPVIDMAASLLTDNPEHESLRGEVDYFRGFYNYFLGDGTISLKYLKQALKKIPENHHGTRGQLELIYGFTAQMVGQKDNAVHMITGLLDANTPLHHLRKIRLLISLVFMHIISGDFKDAIDANQRCMNLATTKLITYEKAWSNYLKGIIHFQRNELDKAIECFKLAKKERYILMSRAAIDCISGLCFAYQLQQMPEKAATEMESLFDYVKSLNDFANNFYLDSICMRLSLMKEELETIKYNIEKSSTPEDVMAMSFWIDVPSVTFCRVLIFENSDSSLKTAEQELKKNLKLNQSHHNICQQIDILILLALVHKKKNRDDEALDFLEEAVKLAIPGKFVRAFIEPGSQIVELLEALIQKKIEVGFIKSLLAFHRGAKQTAAPVVFDKEAKSLHRVSTDIPPTAGLLTNREIDILSNLAERLSNKEIAEKLFISPETVKRHTINIYKKLATHDRREAVAKAQALRII